ncbi:MAG: hypothetical protein Rubg2KO_15660 [Rubricoccaceae bacterium]
MSTNLTTFRTGTRTLAIGDIIQLVFTFLQPDGSPAVILPADVTVRVKRPSEVVQPSDIFTDGDLSVSNGVVTLPYSVSESGTHDIHAEWTDGVNGVGLDGEFKVGENMTA